MMLSTWMDVEDEDGNGLRVFVTAAYWPAADGPDECQADEEIEIAEIELDGKPAPDYVWGLVSPADVLQQAKDDAEADENAWAEMMGDQP